METTANEVRAFARGYASAVEAHCLSLLRCLDEIHIQRRYDVLYIATHNVKFTGEDVICFSRKLFIELPAPVTTLRVLLEKVLHQNA